MKDIKSYHIHVCLSSNLPIEKKYGGLRLGEPLPGMAWAFVSKAAKYDNEDRVYKNKKSLDL
jgi:hypothetical protein